MRAMENTSDFEIGENINETEQVTTKYNNRTLQILFLCFKLNIFKMIDRPHNSNDSLNKSGLF